MKKTKLGEVVDEMIEDRLLALLGTMRHECMKHSWDSETEKDYQQIVALIKDKTASKEHPESYGLIRESLVNEIRDASRWSAIVDAWMALLHVRLRAKRLQEEKAVLGGNKHETTVKGSPD